MDNKAAQAKLARRLAKLAKAYGFAKIGSEYSKAAGDNIHLFDFARVYRQPEGAYTFDIELKVFSPGFHRRLYEIDAEAIYYFQLRTTLLHQMGYSNGEVWSAETNDVLEQNLADMEVKFGEIAVPFFARFTTEASVVESYRNHPTLVARGPALLEWELAFYEGRTDRASRPC